MNNVGSVQDYRNNLLNQAYVSDTLPEDFYEMDPFASAASVKKQDQYNHKRMMRGEEPLPSYILPKIPFGKRAVRSSQADINDCQNITQRLAGIGEKINQYSIEKDKIENRVLPRLYTWSQESKRLLSLLGAAGIASAVFMPESPWVYGTAFTLGIGVSLYEIFYLNHAIDTAHTIIKNLNEKTIEATKESGKICTAYSNTNLSQSYVSTKAPSKAPWQW